MPACADFEASIAPESERIEADLSGGQLPQCLGNRPFRKRSSKHLIQRRSDALRRARHNDIVVFMIPELVSQPGHSAQVLPVGLHFVSLREFRDMFAFNPQRGWLFEGFKAACHDLRIAGCARIFVGGSYVTSKPDPGDYDACWDPVGVSSDLEPALYDENLLIERRERYRGDLLIGGCDSGPSGENFRFLSRDKGTGQERGMIGIKLKLLEIMNS